MLVALNQRRTALLRDALDSDDAERVLFAEMEQLGRNPGRIIGAWHDFVERHSAPGRPVRGIGEPIWSGRSDDEIDECHRHESLLNLAFADAPAFWLLCPYDASGLGPGVLAGARCSHPLVHERGESRSSDAYSGTPSPFTGALTEPERPAEELPFDVHDLRAVRLFVADRAREAGMSEARTDDIVLAVNELATNSMRHGGGGLLRTWLHDDSLICEVVDAGRIDQPLAGRRRPPLEMEGGRGLWLVNHLCDLVQIRALPRGTVVRVHMRRAA